MNVAIVLAVSLTLLGCSTTPKKEYEWISSNGEKIKDHEFQLAKDKCDYDNKFKAAQDLLSLAMSVGRYESKNDTSTSDGYIKKASELVFEVSSCMKKEGFIKREKKKIN
ncbi:hypothetical protein [Vibrio nigripulchritudo]|uniref:hypothetical protein n=1 Tax=Vibrio nigripulchritudo TaxID=28173 RepID=UPI0005F9C0B0|nr:hypothetical protein [Vibrio nigripulchritudo]KJY68103.1 hypothetical protein TW74_25925 [Vibrio nigripulchritudo]